jgi:predicted nucleic acid-binding Zn ribbon protein
MQMQSPLTSNPSPVDTAQRRLALEQRLKNGANWFFWIAGLSAINSILYATGSTTSFIFGLGVTQVVDVFVAALVQELGAGSEVVRVIGWGANLLIVGFIILLGVLGRKRQRWAMILGMALYLVDALILLYFKDYLSAVFHAYALFGLWTGFRAIKLLEEFEKVNFPVVPSSTTLQYPAAIQNVDENPKSRRAAMLVTAVAILIALGVTVALMLMK